MPPGGINSRIKMVNGVIFRIAGRD